MKIGFTCGAFDLCHAGHMLMFKECKEYCDFLIVGLHTDPSIDRPEKNKPVQSVEERMIQLEAIKYIDKIITYTTEKELYALLSENPHNIDMRIIGSDWKGKLYTGHDLPLTVLFNSRSHPYSSSNLRRRVVEAEKEHK
ncbi:MAG: adenylyltransferase/cytidyltransferase family protein [Candidatus Pacebacteria bacterium]|nr:adenylyltransferase/cytidyltransferase family protein [Candidatus Paceibacterota bacterium]MBP9866548.1 adenylyltransferase/cytidyltransferase family protein [Candidatus Paceibacterota bacterium]